MASELVQQDSHPSLAPILESPQRSCKSLEVAKPYIRQRSVVEFDGPAQTSTPKYGVYTDR